MATQGAALGVLFETVRAGVREGLIEPPPEAERRALGGMFDALKKEAGKCRFMLDARQGYWYGIPKIGTEGKNAMTKAVAYFRVSTRKQGRSGLGLEAQRAAVESFAKQSGAVVLKDFCEVESGKKSNRPELAAALAFAKRAGATLVVAKLDRLARNVAFLSRLMESGVQFVACDNPHATPFTIHILAAVAEWEAEAISKRTKEGLAAAKRRGVKLGSARPGHWQGREEARLEGARKGAAAARKVRSAKAREEYADLVPAIQAMREEGKSFRAIAEALNAEGHRTRRGADFVAATVHKILRRAEG